MEIKSFRASSMQEALQLVRRELGAGAAVLHTREIPRRGMRGWLGAREWELAATDGAHVPSRFPSERHQEVAPPESWEPTDIVLEGPPELIAARTPEAFFTEKIPLFAAEYSSGSFGLDKAYALIENADPGLDLSQLASEPGLWNMFRLVSGKDRHWIESLQAAGIAEATIRKLFERVQASTFPPEATNAQRSEAVRHAIAEQLQTGRDLNASETTARIIAVIGPTGVGKTTTVAKLAARAKFDQQKRVGLITVDTYRIAAVDQLQTYAEIMDLPMRVVSSPSEVQEAINSLSHCDQIFVDTAGSSPLDGVQVQQLRAIVAAANPDETYLVVSVTSSGRVLSAIRELFSEVGPTALVLTKLDEVEVIGNALEFLVTASMPISYVTNGQDVPDSIELANAEDLARRVF